VSGGANYFPGQIIVDCLALLHFFAAPESLFQSRRCHLKKGKMVFLAAAAVRFRGSPAALNFPRLTPPH